MSRSLLPKAVERYVTQDIARETAIQKKLRSETARLPQAGMQIGADQGALLSLLVRAIGAKKVIEIGTFTGYSALCIARGLGDLSRAHALLDESRARFEAAGDSAGLATVLVRGAYISFVEGDLDAARRQLQGALELRTRLRDRRGRGLALSGLGLIETTGGEHDAAEQYLAEARYIFRRAGDRWGIASTLWRTAELAIARDELDDAEAALEEAHAVLRVTQRQRWIANTLTGLAEVAVLRGDDERAVDLLSDARDRYALRDDALGVASVDQRLAQLAK